MRQCSQALEVRRLYGSVLGGLMRGVPGWGKGVRAARCRAAMRQEPADSGEDARSNGGCLESGEGMRK